jgi:pimeloyl-ACP methyl ester carboxylesterase
MQNLRKYGRAPYCVAVVHGGPGAPGEMAPVARELAANRGVLEPLQTKDTLEGQVAELRAVLENNANLPVTLLGYSWGAWLSLIVAARYPFMIKRLLLISSGPFEESYARDIMKTRLARLSNGERQEARALIESFSAHDRSGMNKKLARFGQLMARADAYDPMPSSDEVLEGQYAIFQRVWQQAEALRHKGELLQLAADVQCPVTALHGDHDPHRAEGVERSLSNVLKDFRFILIKNCGHKPWVERQARGEFYRILEEELRE